MVTLLEFRMSMENHIFFMEKLTIGFPPEHKTTKRRRIVYTMVEAECAKPTRQAAEVTEA